VAVPIVGPDEEIVGTICVFDLQPLEFGSELLEALKALGRRGVPPPGPAEGPRAAPEAHRASIEAPLAPPEGPRAPAAAPDVVGEAPRPFGEAPAPSGPAPPPFEPPSAQPVDAGLPSEASTPADARPTAPPGDAEESTEGGGEAPPSAPAIPAASALLERRDAAFLIGREQARMRRERRPMAIVAFAVNSLGPTPVPAPDAAEALVGDVGTTLAEAIRAADVAVRWSADQLLLLMPGLGAGEARPVAERVRAMMQVAAGRRAAVSGGVAELLPEEPLEEAVARAELQLQVARERGHNRIA
jgi:hypothetical protein